jgi:hypothetical protein
MQLPRDSVPRTPCDAPVNPRGGRAFKNGSEGLVGVKVYGENHTQSKEYAKDHYICMYA